MTAIVVALVVIASVGLLAALAAILVWIVAALVRGVGRARDVPPTRR